MRSPSSLLQSADKFRVVMKELADTKPVVLGMAVIVGFVAVHVVLALLVPSTLWAMLTGGPHIAKPRLGAHR